MEQRISQSLVRISDVTPKDMRRTQKVDLVMVKGLWQAFLLSRRATGSESPADCRLEYLFWRIWSSEDLLATMKVGQLNDLVSRILLPASQKATQLPSHPEYHPVTDSPPRMELQTKAKSQPTEARTMPQPILKKSSMSQGESNKTTRLLLEQPDGGSITRNPSHSPTSSYQEPQPKELTTGRQVSKKPRSTSGIRAGRRRPVFNRRKSSQVSMTKTTTGPSNEQQQQQQQVNQNQPKGQHHLRPPADPLECVGSFELVFDPDYVPPIDDSPPPPTPIKTREDIELDKIKEALADIGSIDIPRIASKTPTATTTAATTPDETDQTDPLLSQGLETVSHALQEIHSLARNNPEPHAESKDPSRYSNGIPKPFSSAPVPGFPHLRRIPMPQQMERILLDILNDDTPNDGPFPLPMRPWWAYEHQWQPLPRQEYLSDWMLVSENWDRQPSNAPLVRPGFRTRFVDEAANARAEEEAAITILNEAHISASGVQSGRAEEDGEQHCSALSQMVGSESEENRLAREEELQLERRDEQPDQQQQQQQYLHDDQNQYKQAAWDGNAGSYMPEIESPFAKAGVGGSFHLVNPPSYRNRGCVNI